MKITFKQIIKDYDFIQLNEHVYCADFEDESVELYKFGSHYIVRVEMCSCDTINIMTCNSVAELYEALSKCVHC